MAMTSALQLQDKLDTYGTIRMSSSPALPPLPTDKPRPSTTSATSSAASSPFTRSPYNTTPKRKLLRKGSSVEFAAHHLDEDAANGEEKQRRECRRLSLREKQELYKVRPDLEIGTPLAVQSLIEEQSDQRRRVACSLFAGIGCVLMLILFYYFIAWNMRDDPDFQ